MHGFGVGVGGDDSSESHCKLYLLWLCYQVTPCMAGCLVVSNL